MNGTTPLRTLARRRETARGKGRTATSRRRLPLGADLLVLLLALLLVLLLRMAVGEAVRLDHLALRFGAEEIGRQLRRPRGLLPSELDAAEVAIRCRRAILGCEEVQLLDERLRAHVEVVEDVALE